MSTVKTSNSKSPIWITEPFRVFFPLGAAASLFGAAIWPLFYAGLWPFAPHIQHPRIMIFGFGFAFLVGFLGTAWPRFLEAAPLKRSELYLLIATWLGAQILYGAHRLHAGDCVFASHSLAFVAILSVRFRSGSDLPPPGFALAYASIIVGTIVSLSWALMPAGMPLQLFVFTKLLVWQGLLLLPLLGVGSFLFPRFFPSPGSGEKNTSPRSRTSGIWGVATLLLISFAIEAYGSIRIGNFVRFITILTWAFLTTPDIWKARATSTRAWALRITVGSIALSFLSRAFWPGPGFALEHILFLAGFGMTILLIADRVTIGHCADPDRIPAKSSLWRWLVWLILLAMATRVSADMKASILISHHIYASILWVIIVIIWLVFHARLWRLQN